MKKTRVVPFVAAVLLAAGCGGNGGPTGPDGPDELPVTGTAVPGMASVDAAISALMKEWDIPGGAVGIVRDGRLVYARGFGYSDVASQTETAPDALFERQPRSQVGGGTRSSSSRLWK